MKIGKREFDVGNRTYVMGILNVTPDSFSDGGKWNNMDSALEHAGEMLKEGADIIDVGGESTRPGYSVIPDEEEIARVVPVIKALRERFGKNGAEGADGIVISVDTYKAKVAEAAISAGADLINDIWGFKRDPDIARTAAESGAACCLMHNKNEAVYENIIGDMKRDLYECADIAMRAGVSEDRIILDPGIGFGKTYEHNLEVLRRLGELCEMPYPMLLGTSRKSVIGNALGLPADQRLEGTLATTVMAVTAGCAFVRVHDVKANKRVIQMTEAVLGII